MIFTIVKKLILAIVLGPIVVCFLVFIIPGWLAITLLSANSLKGFVDKVVEDIKYLWGNK